MSWQDGVGTLWHVNFKINTDFRGFNSKFHMADIDEATAKARALDLAARMKSLMPADAEIFYATISKDNHEKDSRYLPAALGAGTRAPGAGGGATTNFDSSQTALLYRLENDNGSSITRKFNPIPDEIVTDQRVINDIPPIIAAAGQTLPAVGAGATYADELQAFMLAVCQKTHHVKAGHAPGGPYKYANFVNAYVLRVGIKKGGRVFSS